MKVIKELKKGDRVNVKISPMAIFLFRDGTCLLEPRLWVDASVQAPLHIGTVITIHQDTKLDFTAPITQRLRQRDTGLRATADASLLVESLLDLGLLHSILQYTAHPDAVGCTVVDQALEVVEAYQSKILKLEEAVLLKPNMKHVRRCRQLTVASAHSLTFWHSAYIARRPDTPQAYARADQNCDLWSSAIRCRQSCCTLRED